MAPSNKKAQQVDHAGEQEQVLQAVVVADSAECLLPLANVPLIEYTFEFLAVAGVQETFVFCKSHAEQIRAYIAQSKWSRGTRGSMIIHTILAPESFDVGDIMRQLDADHMIQSDFILVYGDVVSNMKLDRVLEEHRERRAANKDTLMTVVMKRASVHHRSRDPAETQVVVIDPKNHELLHYEMGPVYPPLKKMEVDMEKLAKRRVFQLHNDWIDCHIDICSAEVPALFSENFDYQDMRRDFVNGILTSDLLSKTIHVHLLGDEYACRVRNTRMYDAVARDVISRWTFPMVPDSNLSESAEYTYMRGHIYKGKNVVLARSCVVERNVVIGDNTTIADSTRVSHSTIGANCCIGTNVTIEGSYLWDNVTIEPGCTIRNAIIANGAVLKASVGLERGCVIGEHVVLGPNVVLSPFTKVTKVKPEPGYASDLESFDPAGDFDRAVIGVEGQGYVWNDKWEDVGDDEDEDPRQKLARCIGFLVRDADILCPDDEDNADTISDVLDDDSEDDEGAYDSETDDELTKHYLEAEDTVHRGITENHTVDNVALELNALKMACNMTFHDLRASCIPALLQHIDLKSPDSFRKVLGKWSKLLARLVNTDEDQVDCLRISFDTAMKLDSALRTPVFRQLFTCLYQFDVVEEDAVHKWSRAMASQWDSANTDHEAMRKFVAEFVKWLETAETDDDEDESGDEEEEESDDE